MLLKPDVNCITCVDFNHNKQAEKHYKQTIKVYNQLVPPSAQPLWQRGGKLRMKTIVRNFVDCTTASGLLCGMFDTVLAFNVFHYNTPADAIRMLDNMRTHLNPDGRIFGSMDMPPMHPTYLDVINQQKREGRTFPGFIYLSPIRPVNDEDSVHKPYATDGDAQTFFFADGDTIQTLAARSGLQVVSMFTLLIKRPNIFSTETNLEALLRCSHEDHNIYFELAHAPVQNGLPLGKQG